MSLFRRQGRHKVNVVRHGGYWWWDCTCGHFGYGPRYDPVLRAGCYHTEAKVKGVSC